MTMTAEPPSPTDPPSIAQWPLVGRDNELAAVYHALSRGSAGIVLAGDHGVGKTRLAREGIALAEKRGHASQWLTPSKAAAEIPLGVFAHLLPAGKTANVNLLDVLRRTPRSLGMTGKRRLVLGIDNVNMLDDLSATLVRQIAAAGQIFVVATVRSGETLPDSVTALCKDGLAEWLELQPLAEHHVDELVSAALGGPISIPTSQLLWTLSLGNPLFLHEIVVAGLGHGALGQDDHGWVWQGPLPVTTRLANVVEEAQEPLPPDEVAVLEVLAQSEPLEASILESMFAHDMLAALERRGLIAALHDGARLKLRLTNPLYAHVLRERTPALRVRAVRRELADRLAGTGARRKGDPLRIAALRLTLDGTEAPELMLRAAQEALADHDYELAERAARAAADLQHATLTLAESLYLQSRCDEALEALDSLPEDGLDTAIRLPAIALRAQILCWGLGRVSAAKELLSDLVDDGQAPDLTTAIRAAVLLAAGELGAAQQLALGALGQSGGDPAVRRLLSLIARWALAASGCAPDRLGPAARSLADTEQHDDGLPFVVGDLLPAHRFHALLSGRFAEAEAEAERVYRDTLVRGDRRSAAAWAAILGRTTLERGQASLACRWLSEALALCPEAPQTGLRPVCLSWLAEARALLGDLTGSAAAISEAETLHNLATGLFHSDLMLARAWQAAAGNDLSKARELAAHAASGAERRGHIAATVHALHTVVRFGGTAAVTAGLERLARRVDAPLVEAYAAHAAALAGQDGAELDRIATRFQDFGARLLAAEAAAEAAAAHFTKGRRSRSLSSGAAAQAHLKHCGGARSPALIGLKAPALTRRERQVAMLAAAGLPSRAIADRLELSVRTVDNHLQVVYGKLGISGRRALAEALDTTSI